METKKDENINNSFSPTSTFGETLATATPPCSGDERESGGELNMRVVEEGIRRFLSRFFNKVIERLSALSLEELEELKNDFAFITTCSVFYRLKKREYYKLSLITMTVIQAIEVKRAKEIGEEANYLYKREIVNSFYKMYLKGRTLKTAKKNLRKVTSEIIRDIEKEINLLKVGR